MATGGVAEADLKKAQSNVLGSEQSGVEPPSGIQGRGTADEPYDQGNQPAQATGPGVEPPSGQQGKGTIDQPYDQGNQPGELTTLSHSHNRASADDEHRSEC